MRTTTAAVLLLLAASAARAGDFSSGARGTTTAQFLKLGGGARAGGMGGAYSAVCSGADSLYWNPAGLSRVGGREATMMHAPYIASSYYDSAQYAQPLGAGALGAGFQYASAGAIEGTNTSGVGTGSFTPYDMAFSLGYGRSLAGPLEGFAAGLSAKFIESRIAATARTAAADLGLLSPAYAGGKLRLAATARNLGGTLKFDESRENLPLDLRLGAAWKASEGLTVALDLDLPRGNQAQALLGGEYAAPVSKSVAGALRAGYNTGGSDPGGLSGLSFGAGLSYGKLSFDYAIVLAGELGLAHRLSLTARF